MTWTYKILFVCTGNTCRSPLAEGIFNKIARERNLPYISESAGINAITGMPASENSVAVAKEIDVDLSCFSSTWICDINPDEYKYIAVMTPAHKNLLVTLGVAEEKLIILNEKKGGITDPYGGYLQIYRKCRDEIIDGVKDLLKLLEK